MKYIELQVANETSRKEFLHILKRGEGQKAISNSTGKKLCKSLYKPLSGKQRQLSDSKDAVTRH